MDLAAPVAPIHVGHVCGAFGTRGMLKVHSDTRPRDNIFAYSPWLLAVAGAWQPHELVLHRKQGSALIAKLAGIDDRDAAASLKGREVAILPEQLPPAFPGEYYWAELLGMNVYDQEGRELGRVARLYETGGHDVLSVRGEREHLIPFVHGVYVLTVDRCARRITVAWETET